MASMAPGSSSQIPSPAVNIPRHGGMRAYSPTANRPRRSTRHPGRVEINASSLSSDGSSPTSGPSPPTQARTDASTSDRPFGDSPRDDGFPTFPHYRYSFSDNNLDLRKLSSNQKDKATTFQPVPPNTITPAPMSPHGSPLGPAMLSSQTYRSINLNSSEPDEPPRLITFTKVGQGFNWNEEMFLPSYLINRSARNRRREYDGDFGEDNVEIAEIFVTDEEASHLIPGGAFGGNEK